MLIVGASHLHRHMQRLPVSDVGVAGQHLVPGPCPLMISGLLTIQEKLNYFLRTSFTHLQSLDLDFPLSPLPSFSLVFRGCPSLHYLWSSHSPMRANLVSSCRKKSEVYSPIPN